MINKIIYTVLVGNLFLFFGFSVSQAQTTSWRNVYGCLEYQGKPTTVVDTKRGRISLITWESDYFRASGWTPEKRCQEVTKRFQTFSDNGTLRYVTTGKMSPPTGGIYNVICVANSQTAPGENPQCDRNGLLITLQHNDNPTQIMKDLFQGATGVGAMPIRRGQYVLDLEKYLREAPLIAEANINPENNLDNLPEETDNNPLTPSDNEICPPILCDYN